MDIFKILSRSSALKPLQSSADESSTLPLPSTGASSNPQLFGRYLSGHQNLEEASQSPNSRKRKRGHELKKEPNPGNGIRTINRSDGTTFNEHAEARQIHRKDEQSPLNGDQSSTDLPAEACRQILNSHKVKITLLSHPPVGSAHTASRPKVRSNSERNKRSNVVLGTLERSAKEKNHQLYPQPLNSFHDLQRRYGVSRRLANNVLNQGYTLPTEVQLGTLPLLLESYMGFEEAHSKQRKSWNVRPTDLLTIAPTGSGKTLAFLIPVLQGIIHQRNIVRRAPGATQYSTAGPEALIIAPTKELAMQIVSEGRKLATGTGIKISAMRRGMHISIGENGDHNSTPDSKVESNFESDHDGVEEKGGNHKQYVVVKADILVTTPLLFLNAIESTREGDFKDQPSIKYLVLDEADVLLDPLFREQTLGIWNACINPELRVSFWSATMGSSIEELAKVVIHTRKTVLGLDKKTNETRLIRAVVGLKDSAVPNVSHKLIYAASEYGKLLAIRQLLHPSTVAQEPGSSLRPPFLVFTQTIPRAIALHAELLYDIPPEAGGSSRIAVLHSDLSDTARSNIMARLRRGELWVLVTTDLLSRGVDFRGINGVVNYDVPNSAAAYIHRVGRTGRAGRDGGVAITLYTEEDIPYVKNVANVVAASEKLDRGHVGGGLQKWLLDSLPKPSKNAKKKLKRFGVEARRPMPDTSNGQRSRVRISTKSGFDRRLGNNLKAAKRESQKRKLLSGNVNEDIVTSSEWEGFDD